MFFSPFKSYRPETLTAEDKNKNSDKTVSYNGN